MNEPQTNDSHQSRASDDLSWRSVLETLELGCWSAIVLMPIMYWVSGPAVSTDQYVIRTLMVVLASTGVISSIVYRLILRRRDR